MVAKKSALGKGLSALIPEKEIITNEVINEKNNRVLEIDINNIKPNTDQPRRNFDQEKLDELAESIKIHGVVQPIIVKQEGENFLIIAGERRWRACKILKLKKIPVVIREFTEKEIMEISLIENIQRENLNPIESAKAYKTLIDKFELTQDEVAKRLSKSRVSITNILRLLNLDERVQEYIIEGIISEGHGRVILSVKSFDEQYQIAKKIIDDKLSVRQTEELIKNLNKENNKNEEFEQTKEENYYVKDIEGKLREFFGTKVSINRKNGKKGKIEIEYYSEEDLNRIIEIMSV